MRRRSALPAVCAVLVLVVGQLVALAHQASTRHVTCSEHGEELEAAELAQNVHPCSDDHFVAVDGDAGGEHEDCAIARALQQSSAEPSTWLPPAILAQLVVDVGTPADRAAPAGSTLYRLAPKTSPPTLG